MISDRDFFRPSLLSATIAALLAAIGAVVIVLCSGLLAALLMSTGKIASGAGLAGAFQSRFLQAVFAPLQGRTFFGTPSAILTVAMCVMVLAVGIRSLLRAFGERRVNRKVAGAVNRLRERVHRHALRSNPGDFLGLQRRQVATLFRETARRLELHAGRRAFSRMTAAADLCVLVIVLLLIQWRVGLECLIPMLICWYVSGMEAGRSQASSDLLAEQVDRGLQQLTDNLNKARIVAGYGMENLENDHFSSDLKQYEDRCQFLDRQQLHIRWTQLVIRIAMFALPGYLLARHVVSGGMVSLPDAVVLTGVLGFILTALRVFQSVSQDESAATVAADEINQYLLRVPPVSQQVGARFLEPMSRILQFNQVAYEVETQPDLLAGLDLKIEFGQRVSLVSLNPREAEALISLIPRFVDPSRGQVLIDGQDIRRVTLESLRAEVAIVGGDEPVFNATVLDNIIAGRPDISRQDAIEACKLVHGESFIRRLGKGYETHLGESGIRLDVGQRFRLSLARAVVRKPALMIIQEPDAALDPETKTMLDDTYQRICSGRTVIFVPTRLSTVKKCSRVVMLHQGRVAADGVHEQLVRTSELYRHWEYMRFNTFRSDR
ncbi:MAG: ABC transporter ATP-binding protein [Planctomycetaceae bacterium]